MTLFFNLELLENHCKNDAYALVETLRLHWQKKTLPKNAKQKIKPINLVGTSFLLNPADLFNCKSTDVIFKAQYIKLAGRRDYLHYKLYKYKHLDLSYFLDIDVQILKHNPLLITANNKIYFIHEEI